MGFLMQSAYGGVIYLRTLYTDTSVSVTLLTAKTRVAPLKKLTIPRFELCGALLMARLLEVTAVDLEIPDSNFYIWTDSTFVLAWLKSTPSHLKVYVAFALYKLKSGNMFLLQAIPQIWPQGEFCLRNSYLRDCGGLGCLPLQKNGPTYSKILKPLLCLKSGTSFG